MRTLIFNGCSFVHGFDAIWDYGKNPRMNEEVRTMGSQYWKDLQLVNLSGQVARNLGVDRVRNLARNGNSNDIILFETMQQVEKLDPSERPIVFIGWTEPARMLVFDERSGNSAMSINPFVINHWVRKASSYYDDERSKYLTNFYLRYVEASRHLTTMITTDVLASNLLRNVLCLQNFLERRDIPYVFWNNLNKMKMPRNGIIKDAVGMVNMDSWINVTGESVLPIETCWRQVIGDDQLTNTGHPSMDAIVDFAAKISDFVAKKDWMSG